MTKDGSVIGLWARSAAENETIPFLGRAVVLATGGIGSLYAVTTNPTDARGTGLAIAARAGAIFSDVEFVQFHPTAIAIERNPTPLATEAIRGEGAVLVNGRGERFMQRVHPDAELAPRDIVARGVFREIAAGRGAFLDARAALGDSFRTRFPSVYETCITAGIDPVRQLIPIAPAEHYHMGGIAVDERGRTSLPGLWAAGEVAATGVHGANRLASNSLLEAIVFGARVAEDISGISSLAPLADGKGFTQQSAPAAPIEEQTIRKLMNTGVGVVRDGPGLARAVSAVGRLEREARSSGLRNMASAALLIAAAAHERRESRGAHFRSDYEQTDPTREHRTLLTLEQARMVAETVASVGRS